MIVTHDPVARYLLAGLPYFEQDAGCLNIIDWRKPGGSPNPIIRLVNGTADNLVKTGRRVAPPAPALGSSRRH